MSKTRQFIRRFVPQQILVFIRRMVYPERIYLIEDKTNSLFKAHYKDLAASDLDQKTAFRNAEFKVYSKHGGDGILAYIFSKIGATNHTFVEMGVEDGRECNTANLSLNFGWQGMLVDANRDLIESAKAFYNEKSSKVNPVHCFIAAENINKLLLDNGFQGEI